MLRFLPIFFALAFALLAQGALAQATITTSVASGDTVTSGSTVTLRVAVTANTSGRVPIAGSFRVYFNDSALEFQGVAARDLGPATASPADEDDVLTDSLKFRDVSTLGANPITATDPTPEVFDISFTVKQAAAALAPYTVTVTEDPAAGTNDLFWLTIIPAATGGINPLTFDNSGLQNLKVDDWSTMSE